MSRIYSVETRPQAALVLGDLSTLLITLLKQRGIFAVDESYSLHALLQTHDLDYLIVFVSTSGTIDLSNEVVATLNSQASKLVLIRHYSIPVPTLNYPVSLELIFSDYIGTTSYFSPILSQWAASLSANNSLTVPQDGLATVGLLSQNDLLAGITLAITAHNTAKQLFLTSNAPLSLLNLAYEIRSLLPHKINISFDVTSNFLLPDPSLSIFSFPQNSKLPELLKAYISTLSLHIPPQTHPHSVSALTPVISSKPPRLTRFHASEPVFVPLTSPRAKFSLRPLLTRFHFFRAPHSILGRGLLIAFSLYLLALTFSATITALTLRSLASANLSLFPLPNPLGVATTTFLQANLYAISLFPPLNHSQTLSDLNLLLDAHQQFLGILPTANSLSRNASDLGSAILGKKVEGSADIPVLISDSRLQAETLYQQLSFLDGLLPTIAPSTLPTRLVDNYNHAKNSLGELKRSVLMSKGVLSILPDLIGVGGRRKYGVLFQNNMELRATGGFIGSFAILSFDNGALYDMPIYDVYAADGNLKGHVEPPTPIREYLGEANWYLRDSNFDPDFPTSAARAEWFIQKTMNLDLDGIFALNLDSLRSLLSVTGPLSVPDYNETITKDNLYERAQYHAEVNFFPGSTQKKEFLSAVGNALFSQLSQPHSELGLPALTTLLNSLASKDILLSVKRESTEHILGTLNWNGALLSLPDSVMVVDSNFGVNKANYYISRVSEMLITLDKNLSVSHSLRLRYNNSATSNSWPAGPYKNYSRIYLPPNSTITLLRVADQTLTSSDYTVSSEHGRTVVGFLLTVPINSGLGVELNYLTPLKLAGDKTTYSWYWQKQPGTLSTDPLTVYLNYPLYLKPQVVSPTATVNPQQLQFNFENDTDHRLSVQFSQ